MPTTQQIEWADGSGDKIYISASEFSGNQQVAVSSDPNTGAARSKVVTFTAGNVSQTLTVQQEAGTPAYSETFVPSSYDTVNSVSGGWNRSYPATNGYTDADSTTFAAEKRKNGALEETKIYCPLCEIFNA